LAERPRVELPSSLTVRDLGNLLGVSSINIIKELMSNGIIASINQQIDYDTAAIVAEEMGFEAVSLTAVLEQEEEAAAEIGRADWRQAIGKEKERDLQWRAPVITMLGHVDHGKTSLLDAIRHTNVQAGEAGGITQHIGAYQIEHEGKMITFLDTPGHQAFTAMRARGAQATDIAVLVVAADDGVMPQTREAYDHAKAAGVPVVVALNKIDRLNANPEHVKQQLAEMGLVPDEWGGTTMVVPVSARTRQGLDDLLEAILLTAEETDIRANPKGKAIGTVIEAELDRSKGVLATLLVQNGTLRVGDTICSGVHWGRIRAMFDFRGKPIASAGPSEPAQVMGMDSVPEAGESFAVIASDREAKAIVADRRLALERAAEKSEVYSLDAVFARFQAGETKSLNLIVKADVQGSLEPLLNSLNDLTSEGLKVDILRADTGNITESDVTLAAASDAIVLGFCVTADAAARNVAEARHTSIRTYDVIYKLIEDVDKALRGLLEPEYGEVVVGRAEVRAVFHIRRSGNVAGCYVREGELRRNAHCRVWRGEKAIADGDLASLKRFEADVAEVRMGFECGLSLKGWDAWAAGDLIDCYVVERIN